MGFSGLWVVWSLLGAPGEKKRENQMYLLVLSKRFPVLRTAPNPIFQSKIANCLKYFANNLICKILQIQTQIIV